MNTTKTVATAALLTAALTLTACGDDAASRSASESGSSDSSSQTTEAFNDADVTFAQQMIPHHTQAIEMAQLAADRAKSAEVKQLATDIEAAQGPEIEQLTSWLEQWGEEVPSGEMEGEMGHEGHGSDSSDGADDSSEMSGMMSDDDMTMLEDATGRRFDRMFLEMMVAHHKGAVTMAETEVAEGQHADAIAMAEQIITAQEGEIQQMQQLLNF